MARCLVIQHIAAEGPFEIEVALVAEGVTVQTCRIFAGDHLAGDMSGFDGLVVMGGPMAAHSDQDFPTRRAELALIADALAHGLPILGICLGAQLLAAAAGGAVYPGPEGAEIGWDAVHLLDACRTDRLFADLPASMVVLQWHSDTFDLPSDGQLLASNATYPNQAFRLGTAAWGLQFHVEVDAAAVAGFLDAFAADAGAIPGGAAVIRSVTPAALDQLGPARRLLLSRFAQLVAAGVSEEDLVGFD